MWKAKGIMATDGHILAVLPVEVDTNDHSGLIPVEAMRAMRAMQKRNKGIPLQVTVNSKITAVVRDETAEFTPASGNFPSVDAVLPKVEPGTKCTVCLNPDLLLRLVDALKAKDAGKWGNPRVVQLWVKDNYSAITVRVQGSEGEGVIMPVRPEEGGYQGITIKRKA